MYVTYHTLWAVRKIVSLVFISLAVTTPAFATPQIDLAVISFIESSDNPLAFNPHSKARGLYQITPICLEEFNQFHKTSHKLDDLFDPELNTEIAAWYLQKRIPQMLRYYKYPLSIENILISYNAGIAVLVKKRPIPQETRNYVRKYQILCSRGI